MTLRKDVHDLLTQLPGRHPHLESVWWLKDPDAFRVTEKFDDIKELEACTSAEEVRRLIQVDVNRPEYLGPEPTICKLSELPGEQADAYETAVQDELVDIYWSDDGDAYLHLSQKGRAALANEPGATTTQPSSPQESDVSLDARALAVFIEHRDWTKKKIADHLKCNEKSLAPKRCRKLAAAIAAYKAPDPGRVRGSKDADGNLEAWQDG